MRVGRPCLYIVKNNQNSDGISAEPCCSAFFVFKSDIRLTKKEL